MHSLWGTSPASSGTPTIRSGQVIFDTRTLKTPLKLPLTLWKEPEAPHPVENPSKTTTLHVVRIELKK